MKKTLLHYWSLIVLNLMALPITFYLTYMHFKPEASDFCVISEAFNCDIVNKSIYADIFGIPVSILGALTYLALLVFSLRGLKKDQTKLMPYVTAFVFVGFLFSLRLSYIEAYVLRTWCIFCIASQIIIFLELLVFTHLLKLSKKS